MKTPKLKLTLMFLACAAAIPAYAQNTSDSRCGMTNFDSSRNMFTIVHPAPGAVNQQCFITVVSKDSWPGGMPDPTSSKFVEGNYEITLSGGGGGGGGGTNEGGGGGGSGALPSTVVRYLHPGTYRLTLGAGGQGGAPNGGMGADGSPTSLAIADSNQTIAGFTGAESWNGTYARSYNVASARGGSGQSQRETAADGSGGQPFVRGQSPGGHGGEEGIGDNPRGQDGGKLMTVAYSGAPGIGGTDLAGHRLRHEVAGGGGGGASFGNGGNGGSASEDAKARMAAHDGELGGGGGGGAGGEGVADPGASGGNGFIRIALKDTPPQAQPAPAYVAPAAPEPAPAPERPPRVDRN